MKNRILVFILLVSMFTGFAQNKCSKKNIDRLIEEKATKISDLQSKNIERCELAIEKLAEVKEWDKATKLNYIMRVLTSGPIKESSTGNFKVFISTMKLLDKINTNRATKDNCKILNAILQHYDEIDLDNKEQWDLAINQIKNDYKVATNKELSFDALIHENKALIPSEARPEELVGVWIDSEKLENRVFKADGTVYFQPYGRNKLYGRQYWYVKNNDRICFCYSNVIKGGICTEYTLKDDILSVMILGTEVKYKKKK